MRLNEIKNFRGEEAIFQKDGKIISELDGSNLKNVSTTMENVIGLPIEKMSVSEFNILENKDDNTIYALTDDDKEYEITLNVYGPEGTLYGYDISGVFQRDEGTVSYYDSPNKVVSYYAGTGYTDEDGVNWDSGTTIVFKGHFNSLHFWGWGHLSPRELLIDSNIIVTSCRNMFLGTGSIEYEERENVTMFSNAENYAIMFKVDTSKAKDFTRCFAANNICSTIDEYLSYVDLTSATNVTAMFSGDSHMTGYADPKLFWENPNITEHEKCFYNCTSLTNYNEIPDDWK